MLFLSSEEAEVGIGEAMDRAYRLYHSPRQNQTDRFSITGLGVGMVAALGHTGRFCPITALGGAGLGGACALLANGILLWVTPRDT